MNYLKATNLSFNTPHKNILQEIEFEVSLGEFVVILGPNGAGKSTLLRLLTGFLPPTTGEISLLGNALASLSASELAKKRAVMQQQISLEINLSVFELITFARSDEVSLEHHKKQNCFSLADDTLQEILTITECIPLLNRNISTLSGGEKQRVLLARTLYQIWHNCDDGVGVFLDEPTSALDLYYQQHLLKLMKTIAVEKNIAVCAILHDVNLAALYAHRLYVLKEGKILAHGHPKSVMEHPDFLTWYKVDGGIHHHPIASNVPQIFLVP